MDDARETTRVGKRATTAVVELGQAPQSSPYACQGFEEGPPPGAKPEEAHREERQAGTAAAGSRAAPGNYAGD